MYNDCTLDGADDGKPWCSTKTDSYGNHIPGGGHYVHCPMSTTSMSQGDFLISEPHNYQLTSRFHSLQIHIYFSTDKNVKINTVKPIETRLSRPR